MIDTARLSAQAPIGASSIRAHLFSCDNGAGLSEDLRQLERTLSELGHASVRVPLLQQATLRRLQRHAASALRGLPRGRWQDPFELGIFLERIKPKFLRLSRRNALIPNPEWFQPDQIDALQRFDAVLAKTEHALRLFSDLGVPTRYIGFSSPDRLDAGVARERVFLHVAGQSHIKGTQTLVDTWARHPQWPPLIVIWRNALVQAAARAHNIVYRHDYVGADELRALQNRCRFHLCPSQTEGYGHYLAEALGVGAIVLTLDAPPMHELVTTERGVLIPAYAHAQQGLATTYAYHGDALAAAVETALLLDESAQTRLARAARRWFEDNAREFPRRLDAALSALQA